MKKLCTLASLLSFSTILADPSLLCTAVSFDDVLLVPQLSTIISRSQVSTRTRLTRNIELAIPIISSNMDTVTEADMAIEMAKLGGLGIIHRFNAIEDQVAEVEKVKRYCSTIIENPITIMHSATFQQAEKYMMNHDITSLLVINEEKQLVGILTNRDIRFVCDRATPVVQLMTPLQRLITAPAGTSVEEAQHILQHHKLEKLPLVHPDGTLAGLITAKDIAKKTQYPQSSVDKKNRLMVGAAVGVKGDTIERATALIQAGVDVLVVDIAHGHSSMAIQTIRQLKELCPHIDVIAGNVATAQGVRDLIEAGADAIKVGVGPGSICTTRLMTGCGVPQLTAIAWCAQEAQKYTIPIIADGGIRLAGDITKAIAAGASSVMLGSLLAGTEESPGTTILKSGKKYKVIRGMASFGAHLGRQTKTGENTDANDYVPEGVEGLVPYKGSIHEIIYQLIGGLRSGMSYCGAQTIEQLRNNGVFVQITQAGIRESGSHDIHEIS